ncbi:hypothetical protein J421_6165 (plasmid) [Gemmatirosa kalamazoonensis]|uniref:Uncharacterized protein n=1 Tax=Gemmatirosa kalamazoonensis TaxID=861299 RepID=W0RTT9_9BACT|nr:hypothetical protein [Gemmatirosa kalamazoonensis]AHG93700.1 hypothetical protein J421_6165 [Gemmatirosa kalamazoonensis]
MSILGPVHYRRPPPTAHARTHASRPVPLAARGHTLRRAVEHQGVGPFDVDPLVLGIVRRR